MTFRQLDSFNPELRRAAAVLPRRAVSLKRYRGMNDLVERASKDKADVERVSIGAIDVVVHRPPNGNDDGARLLWIHGGGMIIGSARQDDFMCRQLAAAHDVTVVAVDYRLAPEHPFPTPLEDCHDALVWLADQPGVDRERIVIAGASAGGGLCAGLALMARDRGVVSPCFQALVYPMLDDRTAVNPAKKGTALRVWDNGANHLGWASYLAQEPGAGGVSAYAAPARATDLTGLPPAWIGVGTSDLFHDESVAYAKALVAAGVDVDLHISPGAYHASELVSRSAEVSKAFVASRAAAFDRALGRT